jgi:flavin reductase (DIM6/NTAB) family NADH-FMN oxidoreductase RutF
MKAVDIYKAFAYTKRERVVLVVTVKPDSKLNIMPVSWNMKCSSNPPMFAVAIQKNQYTPQLIEQTGEFTVAVANQRLMDLVEFSGTTSGITTDKFGEFPFATTPAKYIRPPLVTGATINFECKLNSKSDAGDYSIYVGEVLAAYRNEAEDKTLLTMEKVNNKRNYYEL